MIRFAWVLTAVLASCSVLPEYPVLSNDLDWIDLGHGFDGSTLYWPNNPRGFELFTEAEGETAAGYYYSSYRLCAPEHGGTHLDAPVHFARNKLTVDRIPLSSLTGHAVKIDVSAKALADRDYQVRIGDVENWERQYGRIPADAIVLFRTGYERFYPDRERYFGTLNTGPAALPELHFPGIAPDTARWLIEQRSIKALGLDTASLDYGQSGDFKTHQILLGRNKPGFENLTRLDRLPATGIYIVALPMKITRGSGAPLRIIAAAAARRRP